MSRHNTSKLAVFDGAKLLKRDWPEPCPNQDPESCTVYFFLFEISKCTCNKRIGTKKSETQLINTAICNCHWNKKRKEISAVHWYEGMLGAGLTTGHVLLPRPGGPTFRPYGLPDNCFLICIVFMVLNSSNDTHGCINFFMICSLVPNYRSLFLFLIRDLVMYLDIVFI